jgi:nucleotide-binding universal stress UspA family protein
LIVIAYDGSADAQAAIDRAGELLKGEPATVLTVWERFVDVVTRSGAGMPIGEIDYESLDHGYEESARQRAEEGAARAERAGLKAQAQTRVRERSIASTILAEAEALDAAAIVVGTRGLTGLKSLLLGSVSHGIVQHASVPVVVVPSEETAAHRAAHAA